MSLLWHRTPVMPSALRRKAMAWHQDPKDPHMTPISVRHAGYAGVVGDQSWEDEMHGGHGHDPYGDDFDEDLYNESTPEMTHEERQHYEEHGEPPEDYYERHDQAYGEAMDKKRRENNLDIDDPALMSFTGEHGSNSHLWQHHGTLGMVNIKDEPVWATQTHVAKEHLDRYKDNPHDMSWHQQMHGTFPGREQYHGDEYPMFVTHQGRLHVTEGHHRVANALMNGEPKIHAWHFNLDAHPEYDPDENDEDWEDPQNDFRKREGI